MSFIQSELLLVPLVIATFLVGCKVEKGNANAGAVTEQAQSQTQAGAKVTEDRDVVQYTRDLVMKKATEVFPKEDSSTIMSILDEYGLEPYEQERERVQIAILKLSDGELEKLRMHLRIAKEDYRDVLAYAEYPLEMRSETGKMDADKAKEIREKDREQFLEWLNRKPK